MILLTAWLGGGDHPHFSLCYMLLLRVQHPHTGKDTVIVVQNENYMDLMLRLPKLRGLERRWENELRYVITSEGHGGHWLFRAVGPVVLQQIKRVEIEILI